jgi:hypothetical protein
VALHLGYEGNSMKLTYFGDVTVADGALEVMDGGTHGLQGHTIAVERDGAARWERRLDGMRPSGKPGSGTFRPTDEELTRLWAWSDRIWELAAGGGSYFGSIQYGPPQWVWAIVLRRGDETRAFQGAAMPLGDAPDEARPLLEWMIERVDRLSEQA